MIQSLKSCEIVYIGGGDLGDGCGFGIPVIIVTNILALPLPVFSLCYGIMALGEIEKNKSRDKCETSYLYPSTVFNIVIGSLSALGAILLNVAAIGSTVAVCNV